MQKTFYEGVDILLKRGYKAEGGISIVIKCDVVYTRRHSTYGILQLDISTILSADLHLLDEVWITYEHDTGATYSVRYIITEYDEVDGIIALEYQNYSFIRSYGSFI